MKFACEHCGRIYAVADELRGRTFKMKCKACGHVIVVKGTRAAEAPPRKAGAQGAAEPTPSPVTVSAAPLGDEPLARAPAGPEVNPFVARPVSAASLGRHGAESGEGGTGSAGLPAPPADRYIDLVLDEESNGGEPAEAREREAPPRPPASRDGPGLEDPFADWKPPHPMRLPPEPSQARAGTPRPPRETRAEAAPPPAPQPEGLNPKVLAIAGGVAVAAVAVLLVFFVGRGGQPPGPSAPVTAQPVPAVAPAPSLQPAPAEPIPAVAEPEPAREEEATRRRDEPAPRKPKPVKVAREERRPEPSPEPRPEPPRQATRPAPEPPPEPAPRPAAAPSAPATPGATGAQPEAVGHLTSQQVAKIVSANKPAFEQCLAEAGKRDPGLDLAGRQVTLMLTVNPSGTVASPTIDDVELNKTDLGSCIKSAARLMIFPSFEGESLKVEVPLLLGR